MINSSDNLLSKLPRVGTNIFTVMSSLAAKHHAINLGQGFPDFPMDKELVALVNEAMQQDHNQYAHMFGLHLLRQRLAEKATKLYKIAIDADLEITITPGGTYALFTAFATILQPGDEVIVLEPAYDCYIPQIELFGGVPVLVPVDLMSMHIDWQRVKNSINNKTKAIVINSPNNPTGMVMGPDDMRALTEIVVKDNLYVISDEVYEHLVFDKKEHLSVMKYPELYQRSFACFSFGKTYNCTGWKMGYCIAPPSLTKEFRKIHQFNCFSCSTPVQHGLANYLVNENAYKDLKNGMEKKRNFLMQQMAGTGFEPLPSSGSYFQLYSYKSLSNENEADFAERLVREKGVATIPVSAFYQQPTNQHLLRFCFAKKEETLLLAAERLRR